MTWWEWTILWGGVWALLCLLIIWVNYTFWEFVDPKRKYRS